MTCLLPRVGRLPQLLGLSMASQLTQTTLCGIALDLQQHRMCLQCGIMLNLQQHLHHAGPAAASEVRIKVGVGCLAVHSMPPQLTLTALGGTLASRWSGCRAAQAAFSLARAVWP